MDGQGQGSATHAHPVGHRKTLCFRGPVGELGQIPDGETIHSCSIVTTTPNDLMRPIHDRMPVILPPEHEAAWLNRTNEDATELSGLLAPYPSQWMEAYPISTLVNSPANDTPDVILRAG